MTIYVPGVMFAAGISLYLFYKYNRVNDAKREERRESLNDVRQQYLQRLIEANKSESGTAEDVPKANLDNEAPDSRKAD
jgi:hypothetical protein